MFFIENMFFKILITDKVKDALKNFLSGEYSFSERI
jgi:hypothetical protein